MPLVYGQTEYSAQSDILNALDFTLTKGDAHKLAKALYTFWDIKFPAVKNLMSLVNVVGWMCGFLDKPVRYHGEHISTIQDYIKCETVSTSIFNATLNKIHTIKLDIPTTKRDSAKSKRFAPLLIMFTKKVLLLHVMCLI